MKRIYRTLFYVLGLLFLAFGVAFSVNSDLGISPVNSLPYALSVVSGWSMGLWVVVVYSAFILVQIVLLGRDFRPINLTQLIFSTIFGYFVEFAKFVVGDFAIPTYLGRLAMLGISIGLISFGLALYLSVDLVPMPMEGMTLAIAEKLPGPAFHQVKIGVDVLSVLLAAAVTWIGSGSITGLREGTIISALVVGKVMAVIMKPVRPIIRRICFDVAEPAPQKETR